MKSISVVFGLSTVLIVTTVYSHPGYYLQFPPVPYNNFNGPLPPQQFAPPWLQQNPNPGQGNQNQTSGNSNARAYPPNVPQFPPGVIPQPPLINPAPQALHNGTLLYYVSGPWGGIKSIPVNQNIDNTITTNPPDWSSIPPIFQPPEFAYFQQQQQQLQKQQQQQGQQPQTSSPNPNDPWGQNQLNFGWGWGPSIFDISTQNPGAGSKDRPSSSTTEGAKMTTSTSTSTTTKESTMSKAANPPNITDTLNRFQQLVTKIREVTRQQLRS